MEKLKKWLSISLLVVLIYTAQAQTTTKPNIIVILSDDAGYADFECYGKKEIPTPNINRLAKEGTLFSKAYVSASVCAPSRAGLLTGRYQQRFGFENNPTGKPREGFKKEDMGLALSEKTIGDRMKEEGYRTLAVGKWHLGNDAKFFPLKRGFDEFYGFQEGHRDFFSFKKKRAEKYALWDNDVIIPEEEITYLTDMFTDKALKFIDENADKKQPFFIYLAYNAVHTPLQAKKNDLDKFAQVGSEGRQTYDAMLSNMDYNIGRVMQELKNKGIDDNTLVIFLNDNGGATTNYSDNGQLRGMKGSMWEGGVRVGYIMRWNGKIPANAVYDKAVSSLDILPTSLAAAGNTRKDKHLDGVNLLPYIQNKGRTPHKNLYWKRGAAAAIQCGDWKLIRVDTNPVLLFNIKNDISEQLNLAEKYPRKVKRMLKKLSRWEKELPPADWAGYYGPENTIIKHRMSTVGREMERMYP